MGKRIITRARGKGGSQYRAPSHRYFGKVSYPSALVMSGKNGLVKDIVNDPSKSAPIAIIKLPNNEKVFHIAPEGLRVGDEIHYGGSPDVGNVLELKDIPLGTRIFAIEITPNNGPKACRCSGSFATITNKTENRVTVMLSSGKTKVLKSNCRATIGVPAGSGKQEKPWVKAGTHHFAKRARGKLYPRVSGVAMSPVDHPYGGKRKTPRPSKTVSRNAPPGAKVGSIAARRTGRRKGLEK